MSKAWMHRLHEVSNAISRTPLLSVLLICTMGFTSTLSHAATAKWIRPFRQIQVCPRIGISPARCSIVYGGIAGIPLEVRQVIRNATGDHTYIRVSVGHSAGFVAEDDPAVTSVDPSIEWDEVFGCAIRGQPRIGMDRANVLSTCWGTPKSITKLTTDNAIFEYQFFDHGRALHLTNGIVDLIVESELPPDLTGHPH